METTRRKVAKLKIDLANYRTVPQENDHSAVHAMISLEPEYFWGLTDSLIQDGYVPTETIILLKAGKKEIVKEGNRRIAALKLILGLVPTKGLSIPEAIEKRITSISSAWKKENGDVPCLLFEESESEKAEKIVARVHGRMEKASRLPWNSVARARHNREENDRSEPGLDLLEMYLEHGKNITRDQRERWAGDYPLTGLNDALSRLSQATGIATGSLADKYSEIKNREGLENILRDIGQRSIGFPEVRNKAFDFTSGYGFTLPVSSSSASQPGATGPNTTPPPGTASGNPSNPTGNMTTPPAAIKKNPPAIALDDPKTVTKALGKFVPRGSDREKLASFLKETKKLRLRDHPLSFCFMLRGMFEVSAKAYANAHGIPLVDKGRDKYLADMLDDVAKDLTKSLDKKHPTSKAIQGAVTELKSKEGLLSITSLNQIVHGPTFSLDERHICTRFGNVFPLLQAMNQ